MRRRRHQSDVLLRKVKLNSPYRDFLPRLSKRAWSGSQSAQTEGRQDDAQNCPRSAAHCVHALTRDCHRSPASAPACRRWGERF